MLNSVKGKQKSKHDLQPEKPAYQAQLHLVQARAFPRWKASGVPHRKREAGGGNERLRRNDSGLLHPLATLNESVCCPILSCI